MPRLRAGVAESGFAADAVAYNTAPEFWQLYREVVAYTHAHPSLLGRWHQTGVDPHRAQHADSEAPAISVAFVLNGLYLAVECGFTGYEIRDAGIPLRWSLPSHGSPRKDR